MRFAPFITLSFLIVLSVKGFADSKVIFHFEGKKFKNLEMNLGISNGSHRTKTLSIPGKSDDGRNWSFEYNDSAFETMCSVTFRDIDEMANVSHLLFFDKAFGKDTLSNGSITFSKKQSEVNLRYRRTDVLVYGGEYNQKEKRYSSRRVVQDHFLVEDSNDSGILSAIECSQSIYCLFPYTESYDEELNLYKKMAREYPDSKFLAAELGNHLDFFHSKQDIKTLYQCFSPSIHQSIYGKYIEDFLNSTHTRFEFHTFENAYLPSSSTGKVEPIIRDSDKYNLILFSASTCVPCRAEVPLLKKIIQEYSGKLEMTYITIDDPKYLENWRSFLKSDGIPWRSLEASNKVQEIRTRYFVSGVPYCLLVFPGGKDLKVIDVRRKEDFKYLTNMLSSTN